MNIVMRYFFNLHECGQITFDEDGMDHTDIGSVRRSAIQAARDIMAAEVRDGQLCLSCHIEVFDAAGHQVLKLLFKDAIGVTGL
jgi:hypothetical protein